MAAAEEQVNEEELEQQINEEYKVWKKNAPFLYDVVITHALEWPSLTVDWLPLREIHEDREYSEQQLVLGTHTSDSEPNYLLLAKVRLPLPDTEIDARKYDDEKGELGGFGSVSAKIEVSIKINHEGEVNRARHCPQNPFMIATKTVAGDVLVFDTTKHESVPKDDKCAPQLRCKGHTDEGYALAWAPHTEGMLLSGGNDTKVLVWDMRGTRATQGSIQPLFKCEAHTDVVEEVAWHRQHKHVFGSVGDDKRIILWDTRKTDAPTSIISDGHTREVNGISFNPFSEVIFATSSSDHTVKMWDMRKLDKPMHDLRGHTDEVFQVQWAPFHETILASCSADRRCYVWDVSRIGLEQSAEDAEDGPPELLFIHGGHTSKISDMSWNLNDAWVVATVAEDNIMQIWQMAENIYSDENDDEDEAGADSGEGDTAEAAGPTADQLE